MSEADAGDLRLRLVATFAGGELRLSTTGGQHYATLPLDEVDPVDALLQLQEHRKHQEHHGGELHPLASLDRLDAALRRNGWRRTAAWSTHLDGTTTTVEAD